MTHGESPVLRGELLLTIIWVQTLCHEPLCWQMLGSNARTSLVSAPPLGNLDVSEGVALIQEGGDQAIAARYNLRDCTCALESVGRVALDGLFHRLHGIVHGTHLQDLPQVGGTSLLHSCEGAATVSQLDRLQVPQRPHLRSGEVDRVLRLWSHEARKTFVLSPQNIFNFSSAPQEPRGGSIQLGQWWREMAQQWHNRRLLRRFCDSSTQHWHVSRARRPVMHHRAHVGTQCRKKLIQTVACLCVMQTANSDKLCCLRQQPTVHAPSEFISL